MRTDTEFHFGVGHTDLEGFHGSVGEKEIRRYEFSFLNTKAR
jgi:hypothetical protein